MSRRVVVVDRIEVVAGRIVVDHHIVVVDRTGAVVVVRIGTVAGADRRVLVEDMGNVMASGRIVVVEDIGCRRNLAAVDIGSHRSNLDLTCCCCC